MASPATRDALIAGWWDLPSAVPILTEAAQAVPDADPIAAQVCAALAVIAFIHHAQPLALLAIDRALRIDPRHQLAQLLYSAWCVGITPAELAAGVR